MAQLTDPDARVRVLVADDENLMRAGLRLMIDGARGIEVVGEAADGAEAVTLTRELDPDVVLMDVRMPRMNGLDATRALADEGARARVVVLTAFDTDDYLLDALRGGAVSFLLKDSPRRPSSKPCSTQPAAVHGSRRRCWRGSCAWLRTSLQVRVLSRPTVSDSAAVRPGIQPPARRQRSHHPPPRRPASRSASGKWPSSSPRA